MRWLRSLLKRSGPAEDVVALEGEVQQLRLEVEEQLQAVARLKATLGQQRGQEQERLNAMVQSRIEDFMEGLATPLAQLHTQAHLLEVEGKPVGAADVLAVARQIRRLCEDRGLTVEGTVGATIPFDPDRHEPLDGTAAYRVGEPVILRFPNVVLDNGRVIQKAGVEKV